MTRLMADAGITPADHPGPLRRGRADPHHRRPGPLRQFPSPSPHRSQQPPSAAPARPAAGAAAGGPRPAAPPVPPPYGPGGGPGPPSVRRLSAAPRNVAGPDTPTAPAPIGAGAVRLQRHCRLPTAARRASTSRRGLRRCGEGRSQLPPGAEVIFLSAGGSRRDFPEGRCVERVDLRDRRISLAADRRLFGCGEQRSRLDGGPPLVAGW